MKTKEAVKKACHECHSKIHGAMYDEAMHAIMDKKMDEMKMDELRSYHDKLSKLTNAPEGEEHHEPDGDEGEEAPAEKPAEKKSHDTSAHDDEEAHEEKKAKHSMHAKETSPESLMLLDRIAKLESTIATNEAKANSDRRSVIIERAVRDGKISPAEAAGKGDRGVFLSKLSNELLEQYVATSTAQVSTSEKVPAQASSIEGRTFSIQLDEGAAPIQITLSDDDVAVARQFGTKLSDFARSRAREMTRRRRAG